MDQKQIPELKLKSMLRMPAYDSLPSIILIIISVYAIIEVLFLYSFEGEEAPLECDPYYDTFCREWGFWYWVENSLGWTLFVDSLLILSAIALVWGTTAIVNHFRTPFCHRCGGNRTKGTDELGQPLCYPCSRELEAEAEDKIKCPLHRVEMGKEVLEGDIIIDVCPEGGCVFLGPDEMRLLRDYHESEADDSHMMGLLTGVAIGTAID